jgi:TonB-linked SusC/RagA family outer membrane protein
VHGSSPPEEDTVHQIFRLLAVVALATPLVASAQDGTITGRVTDRATGAPIPNAQVIIVGGQRGTRTDVDGQYRLTNAPTGSQRVRAMRLGYEAGVATVNVTSGGTATADIALQGTVARLDEVVIAATGESERRLETGNTVATIHADAIPKSAINNMSDLLSSRAASVSVTQTSGTTGGGSRIRIRGSNSVSLTNEPIIVIDGIRANADPGGSTISLGGQNPSRIDDLNPNDIEDIVIIKGPAAAALYGTAAANGVVQITTKRGLSGRTRWTAYADGGSLKEDTDFPANYQRIGLNSAGNRVSRCTLLLESAGGCTPKPDSLRSYNPLEENSPFVTGYREQFGASAAGGVNLLQYFLGADFSREQGVYPNNMARRVNLRTNLNAELTSRLTAAARIGFGSNRLDLPQNDNNDQGPLGNGLLGRDPLTSANGGYLFFPREVFEQITTTQAVDRLTGSLEARWAPLSWLRASGVTGIDFASRTDQSITPPGLIPDPDRRAIGNATSNPYSLYTYTSNLNATASYGLTSDVDAQTSVGAQYVGERVRGTQAFGEGLAGGTGSVGGTTSGFAVAAQNSDVITIGAYIQQQLAWRDRVFLSGAVRGDDNSAFGQDFSFIYYPSASLSWVIGEESFFPQNDWLSSLRLRAAYGESGQRPGFRNAITFFTAVAVKRAGSDVGAVQLGAPVGNASLKPEKSAEYELGFDAGFLNDRINFEATYYDKTTDDALILRNLPPSSGAASRYENLGKVTNKGIEGTLNARVFDWRSIQFDLAVTASRNKNKLVRLGQDVDTIFFGLGANNGDFIQRHAEGHPLGGYWQRPILGFEDANTDGIIGADEVTLGDDAVFLGQPLPQHEMAITPSLSFLKYFRAHAVLNYRGGFKVYNSTAQFRCAVFLNCQAANDPSTTLEEQARVMASARANFGLDASDAGFVEDGTFWKLRELSLTAQAPSNWAQRVGVRDLALTISGRNLGTWTDYTGFDPEINFNGTSNFSTAEFLTQPQVRYWTMRLSIGW